ncbi:GspH/FimT family pseudopilin [Roseateles paludis]|jgi:Tfp pilus assembly protein FimT|uniref:Type II secretion system protein H n=1 Tax=Roseateles paludis TaxID=3145238 RepID=A0ABV0G7M4_9BURK
MRHKLRTLRNAAGFTLIEACMALGVTATLASQALPAMSGLMQSQRTAAYADRLASDLREARTLSIHHNQPVQLSFGAKGNTQCYVIYTGNGTCTCSGANTTCDAGAAAHKTVALTDQTALNYWNNKQRITFSASQGFGSMASVGVLDAKGNGIKHVIAITGRIRSCSVDRPRSHLPKC